MSAVCRGACHDYVVVLAGVGDAGGAPTPPAGARASSERRIKMDEQFIVFESKERVEDEKIGDEEEERGEISPQQQPSDPSKAKHKPLLVDLYGAGDEGAGTQQLLQRQRLPSSFAGNAAVRGLLHPETQERCRCRRYRSCGHHCRRCCRHRYRYRRRRHRRYCRRRYCRRRNTPVKSGLCLNLRVVYFAHEERREQEGGLVGRQRPGERWRRLRKP